MPSLLYFHSINQDLTDSDLLPAYAFDIRGGTHQDLLLLLFLASLLFSLTFVWAGALGNIVDSAIYGRLFSRSGWGTLAEWLPAEGGYAPWFQGHVVDMFHFVVTWPTWFPVESWAGREVFPPIWNLADAAISVSVIWMLLNQRRYFPSVR